MLVYIHFCNRIVLGLKPLTNCFCNVSLSLYSWRYFSKKGSVTSYNVSQCIMVEPSQDLYRFSRHICQTLNRFLASDDDHFLDRHIPTTIKRRRHEFLSREEHAVSISVCISWNGSCPQHTYHNVHIFKVHETRLNCC